MATENEIGININKVIYKALGFGYDKDISKANMSTIQDWIIREYKLVPYIYWDYEKKKWKSYVYDYNYDPIKMVNKIKNIKNVESKEASTILSKYVNEKFLVKDSFGTTYFSSGEEALYRAIIRAYEIIKEQNIKENTSDKDSELNEWP